MPPFEEMDQHDTAVYWAFSYTDEMGEVITAAPVEITCRWIEQHTEALDPMGNKVALDGMVITNETLLIGSIMRFGTLADFVGTGTNSQDDKVFMVAMMNRVPSICGKYNYRSYGLVKYGGERPVID